MLCNGGVLSYQHVVVLSSAPPSSAYPAENPLPGEITDVEVPEMEVRAEGEAVVETYTVEFKRDGTPLRGYVVGRLKNGKRFLANHGDEGTLRVLGSSTTEVIGRSGWVRQDAAREGRGLFTFETGAKM